ncbi:MAG: molybdenum cofactor synthesis domain-containing protein, partial [Actinomycetes bacterium]
VKKTPDIVPLCHPIAIGGVEVDLRIGGGGSIDIEVAVRTTDRTGVEMEALTAVCAAGLTIIDMTKGIDPASSIEAVHVVSKTGGKTGDWFRTPSQEPGATAKDRQQDRSRRKLTTARVITVSTRTAAGTFTDTAGPAVEALLERQGLEVDSVVVVADGVAVGQALRAAVQDQISLVLTCGGTGMTADDQTPEQTAAVVDREVPGIADYLRAQSWNGLPAAALSRGIAGIAEQTLIVNLPGSLRGATECFEFLVPLLSHALDQVAGGDHDGASDQGGVREH